MNKIFQKDGIIVINNDSLLVMDELIKKGVHVDCIVTDPPYPVSSRGRAGNSGGMLQKDIFNKGQVFNHNNCDIKDWAPKIYELLKEGGHAYIMTNHVNLIDYLNTLTGVGFHFIKSLIWDKKNKIMGQYYMSQFEYILFFRKGKGVKINNCGTSDILTIANKKMKRPDGKNFHDTEKPVELMKILVENSTKENEVVLDPFVGIGATALACKEIKRRCIACELDEIYYQVTLDRMSTHE